MATQATPEPPTTLLTPLDVAQLANVSLSTVRREIERGELRARHVGRQLRIDPDDFRAYLERNTRGTSR
jgi:excisionase family DNA binding protein